MLRRALGWLVGAAITVPFVYSGLACGSFAEAASSNDMCSLLTTAQANTALGVVTKESSETKNHCVFAGASMDHPVLTVNLFPGEGVAFTRIVDGKSKPFVGFLARGNSMQSFRQDSIMIDATRAYGQKISGSWGLGRTEFSLQAAEGTSLVSVAVIARGRPERATVRGMTDVLNNLHGRHY